MKKKQKKIIKKNKINKLDKYIDKSYKDALLDIKFIKSDLDEIDRKAKKKAKKKAKHSKHDYMYFYDNDKSRIEARKKYLKHLENASYTDKIGYTYDQVAPMMKILAKMLMVLIVGILSIDQVKVGISKDTLDKMDKVYKVARKV